MQLSNNQQAFLALVRAGLWEKDVQLSHFNNIDYCEISRLAEEQSVVGLITAGIEHIVDEETPKDVALLLVGQTIQIERRNAELSVFVAKLIRKLRANDVFGMLVKGQAVAQYYERPLWRAAGDVDLLLDFDNYEKAKNVLFPISYDIKNENTKTKHQALSIMGVEVELHGMMPFALSKRADDVIETVLEDSLHRGAVGVWRNEDTAVYSPNPDNHLILVFTHFLHHFFIEGVGLRQICDWCRLLWICRESINTTLLEERLRSMGLMSEWKVFAALVVNALGMPKEAMPFYDDNKSYKKKADRTLNRIIKCGNFGHNRDLSYRIKYIGVTYKLVSFVRRLSDFAGFVSIFPLDSPKFFCYYLIYKSKEV